MFSLQVYDGRDDTAPLYGTYCGNLDMGSNGQVPLKFRSSSYYLHITFISDDTVNGRGILATYLAIPGKCMS